MFSEKSFLAWQARRGEVEERERQRIRAEIEAEVDAAHTQIRNQREAELLRERLLHARRHETAVRLLGQPTPELTEEQKRERRAETRRGVERELDAFEAQRVIERQAERKAQASQAQRSEGDVPPEFAGAKVSVEQNGRPRTFQAPKHTVGAEHRASDGSRWKRIA